MTYSYNDKQIIRPSFGKQVEQFALDRILDIQIRSYKVFIEGYVNSKGEFIPPRLKTILQNYFPVTNRAQTARLEYLDHVLEEPVYSEAQCVKNSLTHAYSLKVNLVYHLYELESTVPVKSETQTIHFCDIPKMTKHGSIIINGNEKVVISQLGRSPGVLFFGDEVSKSICCRFIPRIGSWLDIHLDAKNIFFAKIDKKRKFPATAILLALGHTVSEILAEFYHQITINIDYLAEDLKHSFLIMHESLQEGQCFPFDMSDAQGNIILAENMPLNKSLIKKIITKSIRIVYPLNLVLSSHFASTVTHQEKDLFQICERITLEALKHLLDQKVETFTLLANKIVTNKNFPIAQTLLLTHFLKSQNDALTYMYRVVRAGEEIIHDTLHVLQETFSTLFFTGNRYDLSEVGRFKLNITLKRQSNSQHLSYEDIILSLQRIIDIKNGVMDVDDMDHLSNRRLRMIDEHLSQQMQIGLSRVLRLAKEMINGSEHQKLKPRDMIIAKPLSGLMREFFNKNPLVQLLDQDNPLSELAHKRRITAIGAGGVSRERASIELRDVHTSHYGRMCTIETPEGLNIGLINYLASFARTNKYGFITTPYRRIVNNKITDEVVYLTAIEEDQYKIGPSFLKYNPLTREILDIEKITCRFRGKMGLFAPQDIQYIDVSPQQMISISASLIPFIEHNDANRALMGSNMQRQAVPLLLSQAPLIGTGIEAIVGKQSGSCVVAHRSGKVVFVNPSVICINADDTDDALVDIYELKNFMRSNKKTVIHQSPIVKINDQIQKNDIIADSSCTDKGELALGKNILVAFMSLEGYNFEDAIIISDELVEQEVFTSLHIDEFVCTSRETKLGLEEITADIPNISAQALGKLDAQGIIRIGMKVCPGDILVGKITPKVQERDTPEERLIRSIFGEKALEVDDTSLRMPKGMYGTVIGVQLIDSEVIKNDIQDHASDLQKKEYVYTCLIKELAGYADINFADLQNSQHRHVYLQNLHCHKEAAQKLVTQALKQLQTIEDGIIHKQSLLKKRRFRYDMGSAALQTIKVSIALQSPLQPGDKLSGRHGNKGIVSKVIPREDMPYTADGKVIDLLLTPLGIPSRMNIGQVFETNLGLISLTLGQWIQQILVQPTYTTAELRNKLTFIYNEVLQHKVDFDLFNDAEILNFALNVSNGVPLATPAFDGISEAEIDRLLQLCGFESSGKVQLYDGKTGKPFDSKITYGVMYILKLDHLVDNKMHARSTGSYSLITKQPLGGRSQFGGQRIGEMEVWALQAYGASYVLQEMLTIKSDDIEGRNTAYKNIIAGKFEMNAGTPASFSVLHNELKSLGLNLEFIYDENKDEEKA
jgi:DNA-directed RNA polymerase subunit beta